jgi:histidinol-phosphatase (PHP family)
VPWFSYHGGHSGEFCRHAEGSLEDVVRTALGAGFTCYGLSEHAPRYRAQDLFPDEADLSPGDLVRAFANYGRRAVELREHFAGRIELLIGFETEALPPEGWLEQMSELRQEHPYFDYVVGSVHHVDGNCIDMSPEATEQAAAAAGGRERLECAYFDLVAEMVERLKPEVVGHMDLIRKFRGERISFSPEVLRHVEGTLEAVRAAGSMLDVNAAPVRRGLGPAYPAPPILAQAHRMGIPVTLGDDSHGPREVGVGLDGCLRDIAAAGYRQVHFLTRSDGTLERKSAPLEEVSARR